MPSIRRPAAAQTTPVRSSGRVPSSVPQRAARPLPQEAPEKPVARRPATAGAATRKPAAASSSDSRSSASSETSGRVLRGWDAVKRMKDAQDKREKERETELPEFKLKDGEYAQFQILSEEPLMAEFHTVVTKSGRIMSIPCQKTIGHSCLMCDDDIKSSTKVAMKVLDYRGNREKDEATGEWDYTWKEPVEKLWLCSLTLAQQVKSFIERKKKDARDMVFEITRSGAKTDTTYNLGIALDDETNIPLEPFEWEEKKQMLEQALTAPNDEELIQIGFAAPRWSN